MDNYISIKELMDNNCFDNLNLIAGKNGLDNLANNITILETPNGMKWMYGNEIVLTAGYSFINNSYAKNNIIKTASEYNIAALIIKIGRYFGEISNEIIDDANKLNIPLFILPKTANYNKIINNFYITLFDKKNEYILTENMSYNKLLNLSVNNSSIESITKLVSDIVGLNVTYHRISNEKYNKKNSYRLVIKENIDKLGYLYIQPKIKMNEFQMNCIRYAISIIRSILISKQNILLSKSYNNRILTDILLSSEKLDNRFFTSLLNYLSWNDDNYYSIYFKWVNKVDSGNSRIRKFLEIKLDNTFLYTMDDNNVVAFVNSEQKQLKEIINFILKSINSNKTNLKIFISKEYKGFENISLSFEESKLLSKLLNDNFIFLQDSIQYELFIKLFNDKNIRSYIENIYKKIEEYDKNYNSQLLFTMTNFFKCNQHRKNTAELLHIHVETLRYRLNKIEDITGFSFDNTIDNMYLILTSIYATVL